MIHKIAGKITDYYIKKQTLAEDDREMYVYCFELLVATVFNVTVMAIIGIATKLYLETLLFLVGFMTMRGITGGYHADTHLKCFLTIIFIYSVYVTALKLVPSEILFYISIAFTVFFAIIIPILSPVDTEFKPLTKEEYSQNKKKCIAAMTVFLILNILLYLFDKTKAFAICISYPLFATSVLLILGIIKNRKWKNKVSE